jgi:hypothetical protein
MSGLLRWSLALVVLVVIGSLTTFGPAWAQTDDWSFIVTPQVWISHIEKNGFVGGSPVAAGVLLGASQALLDVCCPTKEESVDSANPQWGFQVAAQKGRWTLAGSFQYVTFETRYDVTYALDVPCCFGLSHLIRPGERITQEFVNTTRVDIDLAASYLFPDVVKDALDLSVGGGVKIIYASASRNFANLSPFAAEINGLTPNGLYFVCGRDDRSDCTFKDRVKTKTVFYGATIPTSAVFHLTNDARWLLPLSVTPFVGAESRDDQNVVAAFNNDGTVKRLDGTTFAYGGTLDASIRWLINDTVSAYAGVRAQYIKGHEQYLAYGPLFGMSVRFGGK